MPRLRRETRRFKARAIASLILAIELFNRPHEVGRSEAVVILLQHSFEMLLKAAIYQQRGTIFDQKESISHTFARCIGIARGDLHILDEEQSLTLSNLDGLRNCASHNLLDLTEQSLYLHTQAGVTLFDDILGSAFGERLGDYLPTRVLPVSTDPPQDMVVFLDSEFTQIANLLSPGTRRRAEVRARLRQFAIMESNLTGGGQQPTDEELNHIISRMRRGDPWETLFPGVATLQLHTEGQGARVAIRFTRGEGPPARILREGEPGVEGAALIREVNLFDRYPMGLRRLAGNSGMTEPKTLALVKHLNLQADTDCFREFRLGATRYKRYSPEALRQIKDAKDAVDMGAVWERHKPRRVIPSA